MANPRMLGLTAVLEDERALWRVPGQAGVTDHVEVLMTANGGLDALESVDLGLRALTLRLGAGREAFEDPFTIILVADEIDALAHAAGLRLGRLEH